MAARLASVAALILAGATSAAAADRLTIASPLPRSGQAIATYHLDRPATGAATLGVAWTDGAGRLVMRQAIPAVLDATSEIAVTLDLTRAAVIDNHLEARLVLGDRLVGTAAATFMASPPDDAWADDPIIMWQDQTPARGAGLKRLGVSAGRVFGTRGPLLPETVPTRIAPLAAADLRFYVENIATDFYAAYHRFHPDHPVTWEFDRVRALHARDPADPAAFRRVPSLSDPTALAAVQARLAEHVRLFAPYRPLYYSLGDETGIADLAAAWDFDLSPGSLAAMRIWLRERYGTLDALNRQWGRDFADWDAVAPMTTTEAIAGPAANVSAWADFREFMDDAFARALRAGTDAVHAADPTGLTAIEGAQVPGWGGYDYARLAHSVDVMEIYDAGNNVDIARALNPALIVLSTIVPDAMRAPSPIWRSLLRGGHGLIIWDEAGALVDAAGTATPLGQVAGRLFQEIRGGLGAQLIASRPAPGPVAILYSPASFRIDWLLERRADGLDWTSRDSEIEGQDSALRAAMRDAAGQLTHLGLPPRWVTESSLEATLGGQAKALLLPHAIALSSGAVVAIRDFAAHGGLVLADVEPGRYDSHGRLRDAPPLTGVARVSPDWRLADRLREAGVTAPFSLAHPDGTAGSDIDARVLRNGAVTLIGLQRDTASDVETVLTLPRAAQVYDVRRHADLGWTDRVALRVGGDDPAILAISPEKLPPLVLSGPDAVQAGEAIALRIGLASASPADARTVHVETLDPSGRRVAIYSGNVALRGASVAWRVPLALNDAPGVWTFHVADRLGDGVATWRTRVGAAVPGCPGPAALACLSPLP